jgi:predicted GH43/DUF377 family glycosyl hydrolase
MKTQLQFLVCLAGLSLLTLNAVNSQSQDHWWQDWMKDLMNPVVQSGPDTWFHHVLPSTVIHEDGTYKMWFSGWQPQGIRRIGYAESNDGTNWDIFPYPVFQGETWDTQIYIGTVLRVHDTLRMWYTGFTSISTFDAQIGYAWSIDGYSWNRYSEPVMTTGEPGSWDYNLVMDPMVFYNGEVYHMYYGNSTAIGHATSSNGIDWIKDEENNPILMPQPNTFYNSRVFSGGTILYNDTIHIWFTGRDGSVTDRIGYGYSTDYSTFTWSADTAMDRGPMVWEYGGISANSVLVVDGQYRMWYTGTPLPVHFKIGTAAGPEAPCMPVYFNGCGAGHGFNDFALNEIENFNSGCGSLNGTGYSRYLGLGPAEVLPGETYTLTVSSNHDLQYATVWVDWNNNSDYEEEEKVIDNFIMEEAGVSYEVDFIVPTDIDRYIEYPMRARTNYNDSCNDPCRNYFFGETEDYMLAYPVGVEESAVNSQQSAVKVWPNPTNGVSSFEFKVQGSMHVTLKIYDLHGREVATVVDELMPVGEHTVSFDASGLPAGVYVYRKSAVSSQQSAVGKLVLAR